MHKAEEFVANATETSKQAFKKNIYDWLSAAIIAAIIIICLDVFKLRDLTATTFKDLFIEWVPFFLAAKLLDKNLYNKGIFVAKSTQKYISITAEYSRRVAALSGEQLKYLPTYCKLKNDEALKDLQEQELKKEGIAIDDFDDIKQMTDVELTEKYTPTQIAAINKAKRLKVAGLKVNLLLGSNDVIDDTDLGPTESQITKKHDRSHTIGYVLSTAIMTMIGVKNVMLWGWAGIIIILFKTAYTFTKAYMSYFKGYADINIGVCNHIVRKTDVLKEYEYHFENKFYTKDVPGNKLKIQ